MANESYLRTLLDLPRQIEEAAELANNITVQGPFENIAILGIGGSGLPGEFLASYADLTIPLIVCKEYELPKAVKSKSLVFAVSYSGNTEETIMTFREARRRGAKVVAIASGGKLEEIATREGVPFVKVPSGIQPRAAIAYQFFPILSVLHNAKILPFPTEAVKEMIVALRNPNYMERAKALAEKLVDKIPLIYSSQKFKAVAYKWKINFNENSKTHAFYNILPEMNHNELVGFTKLAGTFHAIILQDESDLPRVKERMKLTKNIIASKGVDTTLIEVTGNSHLARMFSALHLGDLTSYYLADLRGIDPEPVDVVEELKKRLGKYSY
ncbi:MAG: bifunctional phosphoglucose/phosphomannose isomerase [Candidatus Woesearchaeota archaeon]